MDQRREAGDGARARRRGSGHPRRVPRGRARAPGALRARLRLHRSAARLLVVVGRGRHAPRPRRPVRVRAARASGTRVDYTLRVDLAVPMPGLVKRRASGMIMGNALRDLQAHGRSGTGGRRRRVGRPTSRRNRTSTADAADRTGAATPTPEPTDRRPTAPAIAASRRGARSTRRAPRSGRCRRRRSSRA